MVMFWQKGYKAGMGAGGFMAGRFPVLRVDVPKCAPSMHEMGQGGTLQCWCEHQKCIRAWPGLSPAPVGPPKLLTSEWSENHCRTATTTGLSSAALISASLGVVAGLEAEQSVLPKSCVTCQDNALFASLSISLCEDDKFIESNCEAFVQSGGVSAWLEGSFARTNPKW